MCPVGRRLELVAPARGGWVAALRPREGAVAFARHGGHDVLVQLGPLITVVARENPDHLVRRRADLRGRAGVDPHVAPASSATGAAASHGHDSPHAHPPQIFGASVATRPHAVIASSPWSSMRYCTRFPHVASALPSIGADAYHSHAAPHLLLSPSVWPKRGKRPSAPPARSNRKTVALIDFLEVKIAVNWWSVVFTARSASRRLALNPLFVICADALSKGQFSMS